MSEEENNHKRWVLFLQKVHQENVCLVPEALPETLKKKKLRLQIKKMKIARDLPETTESNPNMQGRRVSGRAGRGRVALPWEPINITLPLK